MASFYCTDLLIKFMHVALAYLSMACAKAFHCKYKKQTHNMNIWVYWGFYIARELVTINYCLAVWFAAVLNVDLSFVLLSGEDCGIGPSSVRRSVRGQWAGDVWSSWAEDEEGNVPDSWTTLQRVTDQTDGHTAQHQPQLPALHHPQPWEEGKRDI